MARGVSHGSFIPSEEFSLGLLSGIGTSTLILIGNEPFNYTIASNIVPGSGINQSPHCSELIGVLGMLSILMKVCKLHAITSRRVTLGLDGDHLLKAAEAEYLVPQQADFEHSSY